MDTQTVIHLYSVHQRARMGFREFCLSNPVDRVLTTDLTAWSRGMRHMFMSIDKSAKVLGIEVSHIYTNDCSDDPRLEQVFARIRPPKLDLE